jgi:hypothetical protein
MYPRYSTVSKVRTPLISIAIGILTQPGTRGIHVRNESRVGIPDAVTDPRPSRCPRFDVTATRRLTGSCRTTPPFAPRSRARRQPRSRTRRFGSTAASKDEETPQRGSEIGTAPVSDEPSLSRRRPRPAFARRTLRRSVAPHSTFAPVCFTTMAHFATSKRT